MSSLKAHCPYCDCQGASVYVRGRTGIILTCSKCGGWYNPDRQDEIKLEDSAGDRILNEYTNSYRENERSELAIARGVLSLLKQQLPDANRILEVGCGNASIAAAIKADNSPLTYIGVELSAGLYASIPSALRKNVVHEPTLEAAFGRIGDASQDVVILHHVLEHLPDPRRVLASIRKKLAPSGRIFIEVPNEQWKRPIIQLRRLLKKDGDDWFPGHINFFTQGFLRHFLSSQGFDVEYEMKVSAARYPEMVMKMLGGEETFHTNAAAKLVYQILRRTRIEDLIGYGIVLRCIIAPRHYERPAND